MSPEHLYYAGMVLAALLAPFHRQAALIVAVWAIGQLFAKLHVSTPPWQVVDLVSDIAGAVIALAIARSTPWCFLVAALFFPMIAVDMTVIAEAKERAILTGQPLADIAPSWSAYWQKYWLAMAQLAFLLPGADWGRARKTWEAYRDGATWYTWVERVMARMRPC